MEPTKELIDAIDRDKVRQAIAMTPGQRMLSGPELYDMARMFMLAGIRKSHPDADEQEVRRLAQERLDYARVLRRNRRMFDSYMKTLNSGKSQP